MTFFVILFLNVSCEDNRSIWKISGLVPQEVSRTPSKTLFTFYPNGEFINTNDVVVYDEVRSLPNLFWDTANTTHLFTVILIDIDIPSSLCGPQIPAPSTNLSTDSEKELGTTAITKSFTTASITTCRYIHYLVVNVPGQSSLDNVTGRYSQDLSKGDTVLAYQPPTPFELTDDDTFKEEIDPHNHRYVWLVYKQQANVNLSIPTPECGAGTFSNRVMSSNELSYLLASNKIVYNEDSYDITRTVASYVIRFPINGFNISTNNITTSVANYTIVTNVPSYSVVTPVVDLSRVIPAAGTFWRVGKSTSSSLQATCCLLDCEIEGITDLALQGVPVQEPPPILGRLEDACFTMFGLFTCS